MSENDRFLDTLHRTLRDLRSIVGDLQANYGDIPAVRRLNSDLERIELDASELTDLTPLSAPAPDQILLVDDTPFDPSLWAGADDEGLGGYQR